jgi:hypothetical protein
MQEIKKITEHTPYHSFVRSKLKEKNLFVAKLTSNDQEADQLKAKSIAECVADELADIDGETK